MNYEKSYGAVVFRKIKDILYVLIINFDYKMLNIWGFPKGHAESGENEIQTACREVKEETFVDIEVIPGFEECTKFKLTEGLTIRNRVVKYFIGKPSPTKIKIESGKLKNVKWTQVDRAKELLTFKCDKIVLEKACKFLKNKNFYSF